MNLMLTAGLVFALGDYIGLTYPHCFYYWLLGLLSSGASSIIYFFSRNQEHGIFNKLFAADFYGRGISGGKGQ